MKKAAERLSHQPSDLACYTQKGLNIISPHHSSDVAELANCSAGAPKTCRRSSQPCSMISISPGLTILLKPYRRSFYILRRGQTSPKQKLREPKRAEQKGAPVVVSRKTLEPQLNMATNILGRKRIATFTKRQTMQRGEERLNSEQQKKLCHLSRTQQRCTSNG